MERFIRCFVIMSVLALGYYAFSLAGHAVSGLVPVTSASSNPAPTQHSS